MRGLHEVDPNPYEGRSRKSRTCVILYMMAITFVVATYQIQRLLPDYDRVPVDCHAEIWKRFDERHVQPIFLFWSNAEKVKRNDLQERHYAVLEQLMILHPRAPVVVISDTLPSDTFDAYVKLGYDIRVRNVSIEDLTFNIAGLDTWMKKIPTWREGPYFASHMSDYYRFALMYQNGGTYTDFDALYLRPVTFLESAVGVDRAYGVCPWCLNGLPDEVSFHSPIYTAPGVMIGFPKNAGLMLQALLRGFATDYDPHCFVCVGPKALTMTLGKAAATNNVTLLDSFELYPYNYQQIAGLFERQNSSRDQYLMLKRAARSVHLFGKVSTGLNVSEGSVIDYIIDDMRILGCNGVNKVEISMPDLFDLSRRVYRGAYLFDDVRVIDCANVVGDVYKVHVSVEHGMLYTRNSSGQALGIKGGLRFVNHMLSSLIYVGPDRDRLKVWVVGPRGHDVRLVPIMRVEKLVTMQIKTHGRADKVSTLIRSARRYYPEMPIIVADDSYESVDLFLNLTSVSNVEFMGMPVDSGLSYGRNKMVERTATPYTMIIDDDHIVTGHTDLTGLVRALEYGGYDIVAMKSPVDYERWQMDFAGLMSIENKTLTLVGGNRGTHYGCEVVDFAHNKFIARTGRLRDVQWDPRLKLGEHEDFFWRVKQAGLRVGSCPWTGIFHDSPPHWLKKTRYDIQRSRVFKFMELMLTINGLDCLSNFGSKVCRLGEVDTKKQICQVGFVGDNCDKCDVGFLGDRCDQCEKGKFSAACVNCNCPNPDTVCREGYKGDGECVCKCATVRGENLLRNAALQKDARQGLPSGWTSLDPEVGVVMGRGSALFVHDKVMASGLQQYISLTALKPTEVIIGAEVRAKLAAGGDPNDGYSLYTDAWYEDGTAEWGKVIPLPLGSYEWQKIEGVLQWPRPIVGLTLTLMFRRYAGEVEFRNPFVKEPICNCSRVAVACEAMTRPNCHEKNPTLMIGADKDAACGCAPEMIGIGVEKAGTTSLWFWLAYHPQFVARDKEIRFDFEKNAGRLSEYYKKFPNVERDSKMITGEFTPSYILDPAAPEALSKLAPHATYVIVLRDPVERAYSQYSMDHDEGRNNLSFAESVRRELKALETFGVGKNSTNEKPKTWEELTRFMLDPQVVKEHGLVKESYLVSTGLYDMQLREWYRILGKDKIMIVQFEDVEKNPVAVMERLGERLGLAAYDWKTAIGLRWGTKRRGVPDAETAALLRNWYRSV